MQQLHTFEKCLTPLIRNFKGDLVCSTDTNIKHLFKGKSIYIKHFQG